MRKPAPGRSPYSARSKYTGAPPPRTLSKCIVYNAASVCTGLASRHGSRHAIGASEQRDAVWIPLQGGTRWVVQSHSGPQPPRREQRRPGSIVLSGSRAFLNSPVHCEQFLHPHKRGPKSRSLFTMSDNTIKHRDPRVRQPYEEDGLQAQQWDLHQQLLSHTAKTVDPHGRRFGGQGVGVLPFVPAPRSYNTDPWARGR